MTTTTQGVRACVHCMHLGTDDNGKYICRATEALGKFDYVRGFNVQRTAYEMRAPKGRCGEEGKLWQEIPDPAAARREAVQLEAAAYSVPRFARMRQAAATVAAFPGAALDGAAGAVASRWRGMKMAAKRFSERVAAAKAAYYGIQDNTAEPPKLLTVDPIEEAKAIAEGAAAVVNKDAMLDAVADVNVARLEAAIAEAKGEAPADTTEPAISDASVAQVDVDRLAPEAQKPADPRSESAAAQAVAALVAVLLAAWIAGGVLSYAAQQRYSVDVAPARLGQSGWLPCCHEVPRGQRCVSCRTGAVSTHFACGPCPRCERLRRKAPVRRYEA